MRRNLAAMKPMQKAIPASDSAHDSEAKKKPALVAGAIHISGDMEETG